MSNMNYKKETSRLDVKFVNTKTEEVLFEIKNRTWNTVGELLSDHNVDTIMKNELSNKTIKKLPEEIMVIIVGEYKLS